MNTRGTLMFALLLLAATATMTAAVAPVAAAQAEETSAAIERLYLDGVAKELAVQKALAAPDPPPSVLKAVRTVVSDFEHLVRQFPTSGYADDALWRASKVSIDAFKRFRDAHDKDAAARLLRSLVSQYPTSRLAKLAPAQLRALEQIVPVVTTNAQPPPPAPEPQPRPSPAAEPSAAVAASAAAPLAVIKGIRRAVLPDTVRIIVDLDREVTFHDERLASPPRVFIDLPATRSNPSLIDQTIRFESDADVVRQVRVGRHPNRTTRIVLDADGVSSYSVYPLYNPYRLVIDCLKAAPAAGAKTPAALRTAASPVSTGSSPRSPAAPPPAAKPSPAAIARPVVLPLLPANRVSASFLVSNPLGAVPLPVRPPLLPSHGVGNLYLRPLPGAAPTNARLIADAAVQQPPALPVITTTPPSAATVTGAPSRNLAGGLSMARQLGLGVSRIVIDPGHGGHDPGAIAGDVTEAELVLDIALRVEKLLAAVPGIDVVLTRRSDEFVPLQERTAMANRESADLFLSIHGNANGSSQVRGVETYFLNFANTETAAAVAARENASSGQTMATLPDVVKTIALSNKVDESRDFATYVQRSMVEKLRSTDKTTRDLGVKQAPFVVLVGAAMPSVLAEVSFLTNPQDARLLKGSPYRQRIAEALFDAVRKYQTSLKSAPSVAQQ
jgi:N-acetylmuramoyl-L-alanine amidase